MNFPSAVSRPLILVAAGALGLAVLGAWVGGLRGEFVFDDHEAITGNATIRSLWPLAGPLTPPVGSGIAGRPVANLSFALNYAFGGYAVAGWHLTNVAIHLAAALALFGFGRRTLCAPALAAVFGEAALPLAFLVALLWAVHPVQTEAVTYLVQRTESLMGMFFLLSFYGLARSADFGRVVAPVAVASADDDDPVALRKKQAFVAVRPWFWLTLSALCAALATGTKEIAAAIPVLALLYDRAFIADGFARALRERGRYYLALAATWLLLAWLFRAGFGRGRGVGYGYGLGAGEYALISCRSLGRYLRLAVLPHPLVFDYGIERAPTIWALVPLAAVVLALLAATVWALVRRPAWGFLGAWFFVVFAPTTSFVPVAFQPFAEHRLYLPLAAVVAGGVLGAFLLVRRRPALVGGLLAAGAGLALVFAALTLVRNFTYRTAIGLARDTLMHRPDSVRAHNFLAAALAAGGEYPAEAVAHWEAALKIDPLDHVAHSNLGSYHARDTLTPEALRHFDAALRVKPDFTPAHLMLAEALARAGDYARAKVHFENVLQLRPEHPEALFGLGKMLNDAGDSAAALSPLVAALRLAPNSVAVNIEYGRALAATDRGTDAIPPLQRATALAPASSAAHYNLGNALVRADRPLEAIAAYEKSLRLEPAAAAAHNNLGTALVHVGRAAEALGHFETAVRLSPGNLGARMNLASTYAKAGRFDEAALHYRAALDLSPDLAAAREGLERARTAKR